MLRKAGGVSRRDHRGRRKKLTAVLRWERVTWGRSGKKDAIEEQIEVAEREPETRRRLGFDNVPRSEWRRTLWLSQGGARDPMPEAPWPYFAALFAGWLGIGRDMNGTTLHTERRSWLERNGWTEPGEEEAGMMLFEALEAESAKIHNELYPPPKK